MSPNAGRLLAFVFVVCFGLSGCAATPLVYWQLPSDFPSELRVTDMDLRALPPDSETLGKPITDFPNARLIGGDILNLTARNDSRIKLNLQYSAYTVPGEPLTINGTRYSSIVHLFLSINGSTPLEHGRVLGYYSGPITKPPAAPSNHQSAIRNELIKSRRLPDRSNFARTTVITPEVEIPSPTPLTENRAWCPLIYKQMPVYCSETKLALYDTVLGRGQVALLSASLILFFNQYRVHAGFDHPMLLQMSGEHWLKDARARIKILRNIELPPDMAFTSEQELELAAAAEGRVREDDAGMTSEEFYRELRRIDEEAGKPYQSWLVNHYLGGYTLGLLARYRPKTFMLDEATRRRWERDSGWHSALTYLYLSGYNHGLAGTLNPPSIIGMDCDSERGWWMKRRCRKAKQEVMDEMAEEMLQRKKLSATEEISKAPSE